MTKKNDCPEIKLPSDSPFQAADPQERRAIDALLRVSNFISAMGDLDQLLEIIMRESKEVMHCDSSSLMLFDENSNQLFFKVAQGPKGEQVKTIRLDLDQGIAGACASERKTQVVEDVSQDERHFKGADALSRYVTRNILASPMVRGKRLIGVLEVLNKENGETFTKDDIRLLEFFAGEAAIAIENALLIQEKMEAERLAAVGVAVAGISHYVKNILTGMKGSSRLIEDGLACGNYKLVNEAWPILQRSSGKIAVLVQDMLSYSKKREPDWEEGNLNHVVQEVYDSQFERAVEMGVEMALKLDDTLALSMFDPKAMHDAVLNIAGNAVEACEDVKGARVVLETKYRPELKQVCAIITDNGHGVPEELQENIFKPFFSTKGSKGTGLGLAVTQKTIREHRGELILESEAGKGSTFRIQLPLGPPDAK